MQARLKLLHIKKGLARQLKRLDDITPQQEAWLKDGTWRVRGWINQYSLHPDDNFKWVVVEDTLENRTMLLPYELTVLIEDLELGRQIFIVP